jgi:hypothetical protein
MLRPVVLCFLVVLVGKVSAQNLVPNGSFEDFTTCPAFIGYAQYATGWLNLHTSSADYFNACNTSGVVDVPLNQFGYQFAADGQAYVGMATSAVGGVPWYREIVGIELTEQLQPGVPVCLSFRTAMGGYGNWPGNSTIYSSKGLGLKFFTELPTDWSDYLYPNSAALHLDVVPTDTALWYNVSGLYVPDSAYRFVAVGNFFADSLSEITLIDTSGFGAFDIAYAFVDDIRASFDLSYCTTGVPSGGVVLRSVTTYPMPCADALNLSFSSAVVGRLKYRLLDTSGQQVLDGTLLSVGSHASVDLNGLRAGVFVLHLEDGAGTYRAVQVVHISP